MNANQIKDNILTQVNLLRFTCFFWFVTKILTLKAWLPYRLLPTISFLSFIDDSPQWLHTSFFGVSIVLLLFSVYKPKKIVLIAFLVSEVCSVVLDAIRLQPWEYLFLSITLFYILLKDRPTQFYRCLLVLLASTYFFSGLHKVNGAFLHNIWDGLILKKGFGITSKITWLHYAGVLLGVGEAAAGVYLLVSKNKKYAVIALMIMHGVILLVLGVLLNGTNFSVFPWNVLMVIVLSYIHRFSKHTQSTFSIPKYISLALVFFWFILPATNLFGYWAHYLSSGMYSGKIPRVYICIKEKQGREQLKEFYASGKSKRVCKGYNRISLSGWVMCETNTAVFPQQWYYSRLCKKIKKKYTEAGISMCFTEYPYRNVMEIR